MSANTYKQYFKMYKGRKPLENCDKPIDFHDAFDEREVNKISISNDIESLIYLKPAKEWEIYEFKNCPGLIYIKNPFLPMGHRYWSVRCLRDYPKSPNKKNIDVFTDLTKNERIWGDLGDIMDLSRLRWVTFGYHHNWDTKKYAESQKSEFPEDLGFLCRYVGTVLNFPRFNPEAAIVNFYPMNGTLYGHKDVSEDDYEAPIFSLSFGQSAVFLIGKEFESKPTAVYLHSGDIVVMSKESRLFVHGVPKIIHGEPQWNNYNTKCCCLKDKNAQEFQDGAKPENLNENTENFKEHLIKNNEQSQKLIEDCQHCKKINEETCKKIKMPSCFKEDVCHSIKNEEFWSFYDNYLKKNRININVRQVLKRGQKRLLECT